MLNVLKLSIISHTSRAASGSRSQKSSMLLHSNQTGVPLIAMYCIALQYVATAIATVLLLHSNINCLSNLSCTSVLNKTSNQPTRKLEVDCTKVHFVTTNALPLVKPSIFFTADSDIDLEAFKRIQVDSSSLY